ncbi:hypothetical protein M569_12272 [Genlisea aurea]|uniref:Uncharacterized protein n=1 Tax=Genlisea aurea TaxID=192259 RepID=S8C6X3_9LAMI|nr:hypothetical protein M569_12272 [Genlisea aurea]
MKDRQRWQPEEDSLLRAYVKQYGPKEWNLISQRMGRVLNRDPKSCLERWKNYLKPGIKKGSLTVEEQNLVISLQAKYGNKWKKIAAEVPGRTAKRLGKWWEVFKEKQLKQLQKSRRTLPDSGESTTENAASQGKYDHILETFAEKYVQPKLLAGFHPQAQAQSGIVIPAVNLPPMVAEASPLVLSLASAPATAAVDPAILPPWMKVNCSTTSTSSLASSSSPTAAASPSVSLTLSPSEPAVFDPEIPPVPRSFHFQHVAALIQDLDEGKENWIRHKKEATWRLSRLEQQLESEKARRRREKTEEIEAEIRRLRDEEAAYSARLEAECREQLTAVRRDADDTEAKLMETWRSKHVKMVKLLKQIGPHFNFHGP